MNHSRSHRAPPPEKISKSTNAMVKKSYTETRLDGFYELPEGYYRRSLTFRNAAGQIVKLTPEEVTKLRQSFRSKSSPNPTS